jgi:hypothetical protein
MGLARRATNSKVRELEREEPLGTEVKVRDRSTR